MSRVKHGTVVVAFGLVALGFLATRPVSVASSDGQGAASDQAPVTPTAADEQRSLRLLAIAQEYEAWPRVSDKAHWAPTLCRVPPTSGALVSGSEDDATHGGKLYYLFASDAAAYQSISEFIAGHEEGDRTVIERNGVRLEPGVAPVGLTLVKQSWHAVPFDEQRDGPAEVTDASGEPRRRAAAGADGKLYVTGEQSDLFVMTKMDPSTPDSDNGWVYAVVSHDQTEVRAAGRIASCMKCHVDAPSDRLFGQPWARAERERR